MGSEDERTRSDVHTSTTNRESKSSNVQLLHPFQPTRLARQPTYNAATGVWTMVRFPFIYIYIYIHDDEVDEVDGTIYMMMM